MADRARLSKLATYTQDGGASFIGSTDFPEALVTAVGRWDPTGYLFGSGHDIPTTAPSPDEQQRLAPLLDAAIKGKRVLVCSGGADKLVPYHAAKPFMDFLKDATRTWWKEGGVYVEDNVYDGIGHTFSPGMVKDAVRFICDTVAGEDSTASQSSKI